MANPEHPIAAFVRAMPHRAEFAIVVIGAFGLFILHSAFSAFGTPLGAVASGSGFVNLALYEAAIGAALAGFLYVRGWRLRDLGFGRLTTRDLGEALVLMAVYYGAFFTLSYFVWPAMHPANGSGATVGGFELVSLPLAIAFSAINGTFEEVFVCAYVLSAWRGSNMWNAISASAGIRLAYHLYQGPFNALVIGVLGLIFAWFYATRGRIWPLIIAHAILDFLFLLRYVG